MSILNQAPNSNFNFFKEKNVNSKLSFLLIPAIMLMTTACPPEALTEDPVGNTGGTSSDMTSTTMDMNTTQDMGSTGTDMTVPDTDMVSADMDSTDMGGGGEEVSNPFELTDQAAIDAGAMLYVDQACNGCHGEAGEGQGSFPPLTGTSSKSDADVYNIINVGQGFMPAYGPDGDMKMTEEQIWQVITYIQATFES